MKSKIPKRHDKLVKETFSRPEIAKEFFREFLSQDLKSVIDIDSLRILEGTFITEELTEHFADLLFQFKVTSTEDELIVSLLFEHKAQPDKYTLLQVGNYIFSQWSKELKAKQKLKPIIPLIYYQGEKKWQIPSIGDLFSSYPLSIGRFVPSFDYIYFALNQLSNDQINSIADTMLMIALLGHDPRIDLEEFAKRLRNILSIRKLGHSDRNLLSLIFVYKLDHTEKKKEEVISIIRSLPNPIDKEIMSTYDTIVLEAEKIGIQKGEQIGIQKGEQIGIQKGEQIGIQKGEQIGIQKSIEKFVHSLFSNGVSVDQISKFTEIPIETIDQILKDQGIL